MKKKKKDFWWVSGRERFYPYSGSFCHFLICCSFCFVLELHKIRACSEGLHTQFHKLSPIIYGFESPRFIKRARFSQIQVSYCSFCVSKKKKKSLVNLGSFITKKLRVIWMYESNFINNLKLCYISIMQWYIVKLVKMYTHLEHSSTHSYEFFLWPRY